MRKIEEALTMFDAANAQLHDPRPLKDAQVAYLTGVVIALKWVLLQSEESPLL